MVRKARVSGLRGKCWGVVAAMALATLLPARGQEREIPQETRNFMRGKLAHAQKLLEGLAVEDFGSIERHAQELSLLSMESQWNVLRTSQYVDQSADFRHAIQHLVDAAKAKKIDAAALAYVDVTLKCVQCHKYVRDRDAREGVGAVPGSLRVERLAARGKGNR